MCTYQINDMHTQKLMKNQVIKICTTVKHTSQPMSFHLHLIYVSTMQAHLQWLHRQLAITSLCMSVVTSLWSRLHPLYLTGTHPPQQKLVQARHCCNLALRGAQPREYVSVQGHQKFSQGENAEVIEYNLLYIFHVISMYLECTIFGEKFHVLLQTQVTLYYVPQSVCSDIILNGSTNGLV